MKRSWWNRKEYLNIQNKLHEEQLEWCLSNPRNLCRTLQVRPCSCPRDFCKPSSWPPNIVLFWVTRGWDRAIFRIPFPYWSYAEGLQWGKIPFTYSFSSSFCWLKEWIANDFPAPFLLCLFIWIYQEELIDTGEGSAWWVSLSRNLPYSEREICTESPLELALFKFSDDTLLYLALEKV